jgi:protein-disulfide isomerase
MKLTGESKILLGILAATAVIILTAIAYVNKPAPLQKPISRDELIPPGSFTTGNASAAAWLVEFSDFQCPACRAFAPTVVELVKTYPDKLLFIYRHYPLSQHQYAKSAAMVAEAAGLQGKFWEMSTLLFENQNRFATNPWGALASELKLNRKQFDVDLSSQTLKTKIDRDEQTAIRLRLPGTPTFFLNGIRLAITSPLELKKAVEEVIR